MAMNAEHARTTGQRIVEAREAKGWTQTELAARTKLSDNTVRKAERGEHVGPGTLRRILDEVGIPPVSEARTVFPADVQAVLDVLGFYMVALPAEERPEIAYAVTRMLMERAAGN